MCDMRLERILEIQYQMDPTYWRRRRMICWTCTEAYSGANDIMVLSGDTSPL